MQSRFTAFWSGVRRGSKFGAVVGLVIWFILACVGVLMLLLIPEMRQEMLADLEGKSALSLIGGFLAPIGLMVLYGAAPGAIIMGIAAVLRARQDAALDQK